MPVDLSKDPFTLFREWYDKAQNLDIKEPTFMTLATATPDGKPSARVVLLKGYNEKGFYFYTNLTSRKGRELVENPHAALSFYWMELNRQIRIEGKVERVTEKEADDYFISRRRGSQIGAWASKQSMPMDGESDLAVRAEQITQQFEGGPIPRPPFWSGFCLVPERLEFWEERDYRLHKRILFTKVAANGWDTERLYP